MLGGTVQRPNIRGIVQIAFSITGATALVLIHALKQFLRRAQRRSEVIVTPIAITHFQTVFRAKCKPSPVQRGRPGHITLRAAVGSKKPENVRLNLDLVE